MRVLHVMECTIGGTRRHLVDVARGQRAAGLEVHLVASTLRDPGFPPDLDALAAEGVTVTRLDMVREVNPGLDWRHAKALKAILRAWQPDVVHGHSSKGGVLARYASLSTGIGKRIYTPHTFAFLFEALFSPLKRRLYRAVERHYARRSDFIVAVSPSEAETFARSGVVPPGRVRTVCNGIDPRRFLEARPADVAAFGLDPARPVALIVGLVYAAKGQDLALEALVQVPDVQLLVVGPGDRSEVEAQTDRLGLRDRVAFAGARSDVPELMAAADWLVLPSRWEGMPYVVMEAMAAGIPVLAHPVDGARDLVVHGETGHLTPRIGVAELREGLSSLASLSPQARADLGAAGRARVLHGFTIERMVAGLTAVYEEALA
ncbi:MAG: glycosyltransferase family 4 protein [Planctomycetota bacterium]|nr:glycosyltransferase family 4 protein [Planctomycetota bacterium]